MKLLAVVVVFVDAHNRFCQAKYNDRQTPKTGELPWLARFPLDARFAAPVSGKGLTDLSKSCKIVKAELKIQK